MAIAHIEPQLTTESIRFERADAHVPNLRAGHFNTSGTRNILDPLRWEG